MLGVLSLQGWDQGILGAEGIPAMKPGGKRRLVIPSELAYGGYRHLASDLLLHASHNLWRQHWMRTPFACRCLLVASFHVPACMPHPAACHVLPQARGALAASSLPTPRWQVEQSQQA